MYMRVKTTAVVAIVFIINVLSLSFTGTDNMVYIILLVIVLFTQL